MYFQQILQKIASNLMDSNLFQVRSITLCQTYRWMLRTQMLQKGCSCTHSKFQAISDELTEILAYIQYKENLFKKLDKEANQPQP